MSVKKRQGSLFVVSLGDVKLPAELERHVSGEIQATVMRALASVDAKGDVRRRFSSEIEVGGIKFPDHTQGIWIDREIPRLRS